MQIKENTTNYANYEMMKKRKKRVPYEPKKKRNWIVNNCFANRNTYLIKSHGSNYTIIISKRFFSIMSLK